MSQSNYVKKIKAIPIETNRKTQLESPVTEPERLSLRALVGSLQYAAINTRPDLSSKLSLLQSAINKATVDTLMEGNRVLHEAKKYHHVTINIKPIPHQDFRFLSLPFQMHHSLRHPNPTHMLDPSLWGPIRISVRTSSVLLVR